MDEDEGLTPEQLKSFRTLLQEHRQEVMRKMANHAEDAMSQSGPQADEVDQATVEQAQRFLLKLHNKERKLLQLIERALDKIDRGDYGYCEGTGDVISLRRLEARPWVRFTVAYQEQLEKERALRVKN